MSQEPGKHHMDHGGKQYHLFSPHHAHHAHGGPHEPFFFKPLHASDIEVLEWSHARKWHFWVALLSCLAFLVGNMIGQHGFRAFYAAVIGAVDPAVVAFDGTSPPVTKIVDPHAGRTYAELTYGQVTKDLLIDLPSIHSVAPCSEENVESCRIFSTRHLSSYTGEQGSHPGLDIPLAVGTPVLAMMNGVVERTVERSWGFGNTVVVRHFDVPHPEQEGLKEDLYSVYAHLSEIHVVEGDVVRRGQMVGASGQTGIATTPHLHVQMDREDAPFHPFWPFTSKQAEVAGLNFYEAVNVGLGRVHAQKYTIDPLAYVERYRDYRPDAEMQVARESETKTTTVIVKKDPLEVRRERIAVRTASRLARRLARLAQRQQQRAEQSVVIETSSDAVAFTAPDTLIFSHDGEFEVGRPEIITLRVASSLGGNVSPSFEGNMRLRVVYGDAELQKEEFTSSDFHDGEAAVRITPRGQKTIVIRAEGILQGQSNPMVYEGERVVAR